MKGPSFKVVGENFKVQMTKEECQRRKHRAYCLILSLAPKGTDGPEQAGERDAGPPEVEQHATAAAVSMQEG